MKAHTPLIPSTDKAGQVLSEVKSTHPLGEAVLKVETDHAKFAKKKNAKNAKI